MYPKNNNGENNGAFIYMPNFIKQVAKLTLKILNFLQLLNKKSTSESDDPVQKQSNIKNGIRMICIKICYKKLALDHYCPISDFLDVSATMSHGQCGRS